jgi:hypothetical protein
MHHGMPAAVTAGFLWLKFGEKAAEVTELMRPMLL